MPHPLGLEDENTWFETMMKRPMEEHTMVIEMKEAKGWHMVGNIGFDHDRLVKCQCRVRYFYRE